MEKKHKNIQQSFWAKVIILGKYVVHNFSPFLYKSVSSIYKEKKYLTWLSNYIHCSVNILKDAVSWKSLFKLGLSTFLDLHW